MSASTTEDRIALQDLMLRYAAGIDDRDLALYRSCFCDDVEVVNFGTQTYHGVDAWLDYVWQALAKYSATQHLLGPQLASVEGDYADARSDVQALHYLKNNESERLILWGTYKSRMRRVDGEWKIVRHELLIRGSKLD